MNCRIGLVDLGTNSVRFAIYSIGRRVQPLCLYKKKVMLRPGQGVFKRHKIRSQTAKKILASFKDFRSKTRQAKIRASLVVATSALREAHNAPELIKRVFRKTGFKIQVISGQDEARLIAIGIVTNDRLPTGSLFLVDIGGGSTEISLVRGRRVKSCQSLNLGALRLQQLFFSDYFKFSKARRLKVIAQARLWLRQELETHKELRSHRAPVMVGSSGTIRALARILDRNDFPVMPKRRLQFEVRQLRKLVQKMTPLNRSQMSRIPGLEPQRLDIILPGAILLEEIARFLKTEKIVTTNFALRDGLLLLASEILKTRKIPSKVGLTTLPIHL